MIHFARKLAADESGVTVVEYGLLAAVLAIILVATVPGVGSGLNHTFRIVANSLHRNPPAMGGGAG